MALKSNKRASAELAEAAALKRLGKLSEALALLEHARATNPFEPQVLLELARIAMRLSMSEAAERCTAAALEIDPDSAEAIAERSIVLRALGRHDDAIALLRAKLEMDPTRAELWLALSNTVRETGLTAEAITFLEECLRLKPESVEARANLADLMYDIGEHAKAHALYDETIARAPKRAQMRLNRALILLHEGDLKSGWRDYEWRLEVETARIERLFAGRAPRRWDGSPRKGKPLLVMAEQGLGDQILFASLLADLTQDRDGPILMDCEPRLVALFSHSFPSVRFHAYEAKEREGRVQIHYDWIADHGGADLTIELGSLPRLLRPTIESFPESRAPFKADEIESARWRDWLGSLGGGPKIGLCWRSGKRSGLRSQQYAPLDQWARFAAETAGHLVLVQYDLTDEEIDELSQACDRPLHVPPGLDQRHEIDRLAALLSELDAVVSAPTVVATLAAGVGTPTIKVTQAGSWTGFGTSREALLPAAEIIRPRQAGAWPETFRLTEKALSRALAKR